MHEHHSNPIENPESWDDGTYQTGACAHEKHTSGLVTSLLAAVILLGGLASALGVMNIRLLSKLQKSAAGGATAHEHYCRFGFQRKSGQFCP